MKDLTLEKLESLNRLDKIHYLKGGKVDLKKTNPSEQAYHVTIQPAHAIILNPAFGCPIIIAPDQALTLYLLISEELVSNFEVGPRVGSDESSPSIWFLSRLQAQLQWSSWSKRRELKKDYKHNKSTRHRFFEGDYQKALINFECTKPALLLSGRDLRLMAEDGRVVGHVSPTQVKQYQQGGFTALIRLTIKNHGLALGLHNLVWLSLKPQTGLSVSTDTAELFEEPQDSLLKAALKDFRTHLQHGFIIPPEGSFTFEVDQFDPIQSYHPVYVTDVDYLGIGHLTDVHISSRHELFKTCELQVIPGAPHEISPPIGQLVNSSYDAFKDLLEQMGQDPKVNMLAITGDLVDYSFNFDPTVSNGQGSTGFLKIWEAMELRKKSEKKFTKTHPNQIDAQCNTINPVNELELSHTPGIDNIIFYSLIRYFYDTYQKPVFITTGNHDAYEYPYGISPRIGNRLLAHVPKFLKAEMKDAIEKIFPANVSIPMDHNLTMYEAITLYGPGYASLIRLENFQSAYFDCFHSLLNPLCDFNFVYKKQIITGLEWGKGESSVFYYSLGGRKLGGDLPRATESLSNNQLQMLRKISTYQENNPIDYHIVLTHCPVISYDLKHKFKKTSSDDTLNHIKFMSVDKNSDYCLYDAGSFRKNRWFFFEEFILNGKITHILSGHTHRAALYNCKLIREVLAKDIENLSLGITHDLQDSGYDSREDEFRELDTVGTELRSNQGQAYPINNLFEDELTTFKATRLIVSGSSGPLGANNYGGPLEGCDLDPPNATHLFFDSHQDYLKLFVPKSKQAKPRFCAAVDNFIHNLREYKGFKLTIEPSYSKKYTLKISLGDPQLNKKISKIALCSRSISLFMVEPLTFSQSYDTAESCWLGNRITIPKQSNKSFRKKSSIEVFEPGTIELYLAIWFNSTNTINHHDGYDYTLPWILKIMPSDYLKMERKNVACSTFIKHFEWPIQKFAQIIKEFEILNTDTIAAINNQSNYYEPDVADV